MRLQGKRINLYEITNSIDEKFGKDNLAEFLYFMVIVEAFRAFPLSDGYNILKDKVFSKAIKHVIRRRKRETITELTEGYRRLYLLTRSKYTKKIDEINDYVESLYGVDILCKAISHLRKLQLKGVNYV